MISETIDRDTRPAWTPVWCVIRNAAHTNRYKLRSSETLRALVLTNES